MQAILPIHQASITALNQAGQGKVLRAGRQFEAVLLNSVLGSLEHTFSSLPGTKLQNEAENYRAMGMQALATSLSEKGGIGIGDLIARKLSASGKEQAVGSGHK